jgi:glycosyltransferase involved in cell wall biosynthesis
MKILMIAPEPFFEPRGTPFSEYYRIKGLIDLGHSIDLVTYPFGKNKKFQGFKIIRCAKPPFINKVKTGPSFSKIILDIFLITKVIGIFIKNKYDLIHTHEEANIIGAILNKITKTPHLYDMHSSLVQQMNNFQFTKSKIIISFFKMIEKISLKNAKSTIVICKSLFQYASTITDKKKLTVIENFIDDTPELLDKNKLNNIRNKLGIQNKKIIMYTGTFEKYQGLPLLIESMKYLDEKYCLVLVGGKEEQIKGIKKILKKKALEQRVILLGTKQPHEIPYFLKISDVLVSPRILGTNIPLKIYSYLKSGVPTVATNLYTHTQSLDNNIAILTEPEPEKFAIGIKEAVSEKGKIISKNALEFYNKNYTYDKYLELVNIAVNKAIK